MLGGTGRREGARNSKQNDLLALDHVGYLEGIGSDRTAIPFYLDELRQATGRKAITYFYGHWISPKQCEKMRLQESRAERV
jgi:hypothetical protein